MIDNIRIDLKTGAVWLLHDENESRIVGPRQDIPPHLAGPDYQQFVDQWKHFLETKNSFIQAAQSQTSLDFVNQEVEHPKES